MRYVSAILLLVLLIPVWVRRGYRKEFVREHRKEWKAAAPIAPCMVWLADLWGKGNRGRKEEEQARAVFVGNQPQTQKTIRLVKALAAGWYCLMVGGILTLVSSVVHVPRESEEVSALVRPAFGSQETYTLEVDGLTGQTEEISVTVEGVQPGEAVMAEVFDQVMEKVKAEMIGSNSSLEEVRDDLNLPTVSDYGIRLEWESKAPQLIDDWGEIQEEEADKLSPEGELVAFSVRMTYASYESHYEIYVRLLPPEKNGEYYKKLLLAGIGRSGGQAGEEEMVPLPSQLDGKQLSFRMKQEESGPAFLLLAASAALTAVWSFHSRLKEAFEQRNRQIQRDYPQVLAKMGVLLKAGLTMRGAWERIAADYEENRKRGTEERRYVYEEICVTWNQMQNGLPEGEAYAAFGRRCGSYAYMKFGSILEQNVRQGIAGVSAALDREMTDALEERKNAALRKGEEAGTKLLMPMFLMLGIVLVVLLVPAFMAF